MKFAFGLFLAGLLLLGAACQPRPSADVFPKPRVGGVATFQEYPRWNVRGSVRVVDERTLRFENFSFNGGELRTELRLQNDKKLVAVLRDITGMKFNAETFDLALPEHVNLEDFNLVTVYSPDLGTPESGAEFE